MNRFPAFLAAFLVLAAATVTAGPPPEDNNDFGGGNFGLEPNPPQTELPNVDIVSDSLGTITSLNVQGMVAGDNVLTQLGSATLLFQQLPDGSLLTRLVSPNGIKDMTLPPLAGGTGTDFIALITPATISVDRLGDNPTTGLTGKNVVDGTLLTYGLINDLGPLGTDGPKLNPAEVQAPGNVETIANKVPIASPLDSIMDLAVVDPENNLLLGTLQDHTAQLPTTDTVHTTAASIKSALDTNSLTGLNLNNVLSSLSSATKVLGSVDTTLLSSKLTDLGMAFRVVDLPVKDPRTILDPASKQLILVDGGLGKMALVPGADKLTFDNNLVTALKDPKSTELTSFVGVSKIGNVDAVGKTLFHPSLGNYAELLQKSDSLTKRGITTSIMPAGVSCKNQLNQHAVQENLPAFCMLPGSPSFPVKGANALGSMMNPKLNPKLDQSDIAKSIGLQRATPALPGMPGGPALPGKQPIPNVIGMGTPTGALKDFPNAKEFMSKGGMLTAFQNAPPSLDEFQHGNWRLPSKGLGALPDVDAPNADATKALACTGSCLPDHVPTVPDAIMESNQAPAVPGVAPIVPTDSLTGVAGTVMGAGGNGLSLIPADLLKSLPIGLTATETLRFVGSKDSIYGNTGIPGVHVQIEAQDPLGLSKTILTKESNTNGYVSLALPSLGSYKVIATKDGFESVDGAGQTGAPGQTGGHEYTMQAASGSKAKDAVSNHSISFMLLAVAALIGGIWIYQKRKDKKFGKSGKTGKNQR